MSVVPYNQNKTSDICRYMEYVTDFLYNIYCESSDDETVEIEDVNATASSADVAAKKSGTARRESSTSWRPWQRKIDKR